MINKNTAIIIYRSDSMFINFEIFYLMVIFLVSSRKCVYCLYIFTNKEVEQKVCHLYNMEHGLTSWSMESLLRYCSFKAALRTWKNLAKKISSLFTQTNHRKNHILELVLQAVSHRRSVMSVESFS